MLHESFRAQFSYFRQREIFEKIIYSLLFLILPLLDPCLHMYHKLGPTFPAQLSARAKRNPKQSPPEEEPEEKQAKPIEFTADHLKLIEFSRAYSDSNKLKIVDNNGQLSARSDQYVFLPTDALSDNDQSWSTDTEFRRKLSGERLSYGPGSRSSSLKRTKSSSSSSSKPRQEGFTSSLLVARRRATEMAKAKESQSEEAMIESFDKLKVSNHGSVDRPCTCSAKQTNSNSRKALRFYDIHPKNDYVQFKHQNRFKQTRTPQRHVNVSLMRDRAHLETDYLGPYRLNSDEYVPYGYYVDEFYFQ